MLSYIVPKQCTCGALQYQGTQLCSVTHLLHLISKTGGIDVEEAFEITDHSQPALPGILASALGHWEFSEERVVTGSEFVRAINRRQCQEAFGTRISPSSFAGFGTLGPAVLRGPACKAQTDWDQAESFSVLNFLTNNGRTGAFQVITGGLTVAEDITSMTWDGQSHVSSGERPQLPRAAITVSAWMSTSGGGSQAFSALVAAAQAGPGCNGGFVFGYTPMASASVLQFDIALTSLPQNNSSAASATFSIAYATLPRLVAGAWYHVAASYDGSTLRIYLDGDLVHEKMACVNQSSCGEIVYPTALTSPFCTQTTALTLGSYTNPGTGETSSHSGWLREASIFDYALPDTAVRQLYSTREISLKSSPIPQREYWVAFRRNSHSTREGGSHFMTSSPSRDFAFEPSTEISVFGAFSTEYRYSCRFTSGDAIADSHVYHASELSCRGCTCPPGSADSLTCMVPKWDAPARYATAQLSIVRLDNAIDDQSSNHGQVTLWQRVCWQESCGFVDILSRDSSSIGCIPWWASHEESEQTSRLSTHNHISPLLMGTKTSFRFLTHVKLLWANSSGIHFMQDVMGRSSSRPTASGASFGETLTQGASSCTLFYSNVSAAGGARVYLAVANFWDLSRDFQRKSSIFLVSMSLHTKDGRSHGTGASTSSGQSRVMNISGNLSVMNVSSDPSVSSSHLPTSGTAGATSADHTGEEVAISYELVSEIETNGARKVLHFTTGQAESGGEYLAVVNLFGPSYLHSWAGMATRGDGMQGGNLSAHTAPLRISPDTEDALIVPTSCATDVSSFRAHGVVYLVFAVFLHDSCLCVSQTHECPRSADGDARASASKIFSFDDANESGAGLARSLSGANLSLTQNLEEVHPFPCPCPGPPLMLAKKLALLLLYHLPHQYTYVTRD